MAIIMAVDNLLKGKEVNSGEIVKITGVAEYRLFGFKEEPKSEKLFVPVNYKGRECEIKLGMKAAKKLADAIGEIDTAKWVGINLLITVVDYDKGPGIQVKPVLIQG